MGRLLEILYKNFPKYDIMMKIFFVFEHSSLSNLMGLPQGYALSNEFPSFEQSRVDALIRAENTIYHVEFQTANHPQMHIRMLDYRNSIIKWYVSAGNNSYLDVKQEVLYIGNELLTMKNGILQSGLSFQFGLRDVRSFKYQSARLNSSQLPLDWILSLLVQENTENADWLYIASRVEQYLRESESYDYLSLPACLLVAATLRRVDDDTRQRIMNMFSLDIKNDKLLRKIYDRGASFGARELLLRLIESWLVSNSIELPEDDLQYVARLPEEELEALVNQMTTGEDKEYIISLLCLSQTRNNLG